MIDEFDLDQDGEINEQEFFRRIHENMVSKLHISSRLF